MMPEFEFIVGGVALVSFKSDYSGLSCFGKF